MTSFRPFTSTIHYTLLCFTNLNSLIRNSSDYSYNKLNVVSDSSLSQQISHNIISVKKLRSSSLSNNSLESFDKNIVMPLSLRQKISFALKNRFSSNRTRNSILAKSYLSKDSFLNSDILINTDNEYQLNHQQQKLNKLFFITIGDDYR